MEETNARRTALVTGACGGIGKAIVHGLAEDGFCIAASDRDDARVSALVETLPGEGHAGFAADVSDETAVVELFEKVRHRFGPIGVMVTGAGVLILRPDGSRVPISEMSLDEWERTQAVNVRGTFLCFREFARQLPENLSNGRVVSLSSVAAQLGGYRSSAAYIASKSAVMGLTKAFARELGECGVTVNSVSPGLIDAPMLRLSLKPGDEPTAAAGIPLQRIGTPEDVAGAVRYLVSPAAGYLTGVTIDVNGGYRMQ